MSDDLVSRLRETRNQFEGALDNSMGADFQVDADFVRETVSYIEEAIARLSAPVAPVDADFLAPTDDPKAQRRCKCEFSSGGVWAKKCAFHDGIVAKSKREDAPVARYSAPLQLIGGKTADIQVRFVSRDNIKNQPTEANPSPIRVLILGDIERAQPNIEAYAAPPPSDPSKSGRAGK